MPLSGHLREKQESSMNIPITMSIGVAESHIERRQDAKSLVLSADSAPYRAKG